MELKLNVKELKDYFENNIMMSILAEKDYNMMKNYVSKNELEALALKYETCNYLAKTKIYFLLNYDCNAVFDLIEYYDNLIVVLKNNNGSSLEIEEKKLKIRVIELFSNKLKNITEILRNKPNNTSISVIEQLKTFYDRVYVNSLDLIMNNDEIYEGIINNQFIEDNWDIALDVVRECYNRIKYLINERTRCDNDNSLEAKVIDFEMDRLLKIQCVLSYQKELKREFNK